MAKKDFMITNQETILTRLELCEACQISSDFIDHLIEYEIIRPLQTNNDEWIFDLLALNRIKTVIRLQRDLEINLAGAALVLDLLDELNDLRARMALFEKHYR